MRSRLFGGLFGAPLGSCRDRVRSLRPTATRITPCTRKRPLGTSQGPHPPAHIRRPTSAGPHPPAHIRRPTLRRPTSAGPHPPAHIRRPTSAGPHPPGQLGSGPAAVSRSARPPPGSRCSGRRLSRKGDGRRGRLAVAAVTQLDRRAGLLSQRDLYDLLRGIGRVPVDCGYHVAGA